MRRVVWVILIAIFVQSCSTAVEPADTGRFELRLSRVEFHSLQRDIASLASEYEFVQNVPAGVDALENREAYFSSFYRNGDIVLTVHDLVPDKLTYYTYAEPFRSRDEYKSFLESLEQVFHRYGLKQVKSSP